MTFAEKAIRWLKEVLIKALLVFAIGCIVLSTKSETGIEVIIPFIVIDCCVGYIYRNKIISEKNMCLAKSLVNKGDDTVFNSEYYDLYQEFNYNRLVVIFRSLTLALALTPIVFGWIDDLGTYITAGMLLMTLSLLIISFVLFAGKRDTIIMSLISKRGKRWFDKYSEEELKLLSQLSEIDSNKQNDK